MAAMRIPGLDSILSLFPLRKSAATALPPPNEPKVQNKPQAQPSFSKRTATTNGDQKLASTDRRTANLDLLSLRNGTSTKSTIRDLSRVSPNLSASDWAYQRLVITRNWTAVAYNRDGTPNAPATQALQEVLARMNYLTDYAEGFTNVSGIHSVGEMLSLELRHYGSCSLELVLNKARLPDRLQPISTTQLEFYEDSKGTVYPIQKAARGDITLDTPAFFYEALDQDLLTSYSDSPKEAALSATLADAEFTNAVRRVIRRALHPRLDAAVSWEQFRKSIPPSIQGDEVKLKEYQDQFIAAISETINGLEPDDALAHFDMVEFSYLNNGNVTLNREYETLSAMNNAKLATGTKAPPAVLGHGSGSQNVASTESMLFVKYAEGVQLKVNSILSRALTLAVRLLGHDVYVNFEFDRIDLRPDSELEAFKAQKQSRLLDLLSLGLISDEQASLSLTGRLPPAGAPKLSGTMFRSGAGTAPAGNPTSTTSTLNSGALNQDLTPGTPQQRRGNPQQQERSQ